MSFIPAIYEGHRQQTTESNIAETMAPDTGADHAAGLRPRQTAPGWSRMQKVKPVGVVYHQMEIRSTMLRVTLFLRRS